MDRVSNDILVSKDILFFVLGYGSVSLYGKLNALSIEFKIASSDYIVNAVLEFPLDPHTICTLLNYDVRQSRVDRIVRSAQQTGDLCFMNENEFRKLIVTGSAECKKSGACRWWTFCVSRQSSWCCCSLCGYTCDASPRTTIKNISEEEKRKGVQDLEKERAAMQEVSKV